MIRSNHAVGGFLEDLPVLAFVLVGVFALISAGIIASDSVSEHRKSAMLEGVAQDILTGILASISPADAVRYAPTLAGLREAGLAAPADAAAGDACYCIGMVMVHPGLEWLSSATKGDPRAASNTGFAEGLFGATSDEGLTAIVRVTVLVW